MYGYAWGHRTIFNAGITSKFSPENRKIRKIENFLNSMFPNQKRCSQNFSRNLKLKKKNIVNYL